MTAARPSPTATLALGRLVRCLAAARGDVVAALAMSEGSALAWRDTPAVALQLRAAVSAMSTGDPGGLAGTVVGDLLLPAVRASTLIDRLPALRHVPLNVSVPAIT